MTDDQLVFGLVVAARLLVPLAIPRYPLPAITAALALDAVDQTVFDWAGAELGSYQSYDKAFDVYYLCIAYISMLRNWADGFAVRVGAVLFYYRLVGVLLFEVTETRALLLVFPNTFEYFFIAYEAVRVLWDPSRLTHEHLLGMAAGIWVVIKLPQEYWIHVAQRDVTDTVAAHPWTLLLAGAVVAAAAPVGLRLADRLPAPDWTPTFDVDAHVVRPDVQALAARRAALPLWTAALLEKVVLLGMVVVIFSQVVPGVHASGLQISGAVSFLVVTNAAVGQWRVREGIVLRSTLLVFATALVVNAVIVAGSSLLLRVIDARFPLDDSAFLLFLISLVVTLYDRYRVMGEVWRRDLAVAGGGGALPGSPPPVPGLPG